MRMWMKSACVVLAWSILPIIIVVAVGSSGTARPAQANTRTAHTTNVIVTRTLTASAAPATAASPPVRYLVHAGDTLAGIAARFAVRGGWPALYVANRVAIGPDPGRIHPGTVLVLPGGTVPARYTVAAGDTLSGIAAGFAVRGGWPALYAANRVAIGPDPGTIHPSTVLAVPPPATSPPPRPAPSTPTSAPPGHPQHPALSAPAGTGHHSQPAKGTPATGMPSWLKILLLAVGLLIAAALLTEPVLAGWRGRRQAALQAAVQARRRDQAGPRVASSVQASSVQELGAGPTGPGHPHIVLADHDRLIVTCNADNNEVYVLRPPGEDPRAILRVARLVLPEGPYEELAEQLKVPAGWPME